MVGLFFFFIPMCSRQNKPNLGRLWFCLVFFLYKNAMDKTALHFITQCLTAFEISKCCAGEWNSQPQFCSVGFTLWCIGTVRVSDTRTPGKNLPNLKVLRRRRVGTETWLKPYSLLPRNAYSQIPDNEASSRGKQAIPFKWRTNCLPKRWRRKFTFIF